MATQNLKHKNLLPTPFSPLFFHHVIWSAFGLHVDSADVFAEDADGEELDSTEEEDDADEGGESLHWVADEEGLADVEDEEAEGTEGDDGADDGGKAQWGGGERCDAVERKVHEAQKIPFAVAHGAVAAVEGYFFLAETDPAEESFVVALGLAQLPHRIDANAVEQTEIAHVLKYVETGGTVHQFVEQKGECPAQPGFFAPVFSPGIDVLESFFPILNHLRNEVGRVLEIGVHDDYAVASHFVEPCQQGFLLPEIAGETDEVHLPVVGLQGFDEGEGVVGAAVVHEHEFPFVTRLPVHHCFDGRIEQRD